jgi:DUF4097 and DUF4098 domain-containing protein YvlB
LGVRRFELPVAVTLRLQSRSGRVEVTAEPRDDVVAEGDDIQSQVDDAGLTLRIRNGHGKKSFAVRCPVGTDVAVGTQSGAVRMIGDFGTVSVTTASGHIELESADEADLRTMSSSITVGSCRGKCRMNSASGKLQAGHVGAASAGSMSGSIEIERVEGPLKARSVSGSITAACGGEGAIAVKTVSGKVSLSLPQGTAPRTHFKSLSGHICCDCPEGSDVLVEAMSISGSIDVVPA